MDLKRVAMRLSPIKKPVSWLRERESSRKFESCPSSARIDPEEEEEAWA